MPQTNKYQATAWGSSNNAAGGLEDLEMPSGQLAQVRRPGLENLLAEGVINDVDSLTKIVSEDIIPAGMGKAKSAEVNTAALSQLLSNSDAFANMLHMVNRVVIHTVVQPKIEMAPNDVTRRKEGVIYTDMVDINDKMFIFAFALGGTRDLEKFRQESAELVGDMDVLPEDGDHA